MGGNNKIKLPSGVGINGKKLQIKFSHVGKRYRLTTKWENLAANYSKAAKLLASIKLDLERNQFYIENYERQLTNTKTLDLLDINHTNKEQNVLIGKLLNEQLERYEIACKNNKLALASLVGYKNVINLHLIPYFEFTPLSELTIIELENFIYSLKLSRKRISFILSPLRVIFRRLKRIGKIVSNPFDSIDHGEISINSIDSDYKIEPFNTEEKESIINNATGQLKNFIQFAFWTGMRVGEMFALTWDDIDFERKIVYINKSKSLGGIIKTTKTKAGIREVYLTPAASEALKKQFVVTGKNNKVIFNNPYTNKPWSKPDVFRRHWEKVLFNAKVKYRNPHQMRHTFISYMLLKGNRPEVLYKMVGHKNTEMIYRVYGKFIEGETIGQKLII